MKRVQSFHALYKREEATAVQFGPCWVVRTKHLCPEKRERVIETPDCPELVLGGDIELADSALDPMAALRAKYWGGQA